MDNLLQLLEKTAQEVSDFSEYQSYVIQAYNSTDIEPDISIERCKSLIEGVCRKILIMLAGKYQRNDDFKGVSLNQHMNETFEELALKGAPLQREDEMARQCSGIFFLIGEIRNKSGEVGHGKYFPKEEYSKPIFAEFVCNISFALTEFLIQLYRSLDLSYIHLPNYENEKLLKFNNYLDNLYPLPNPALYSRYLYNEFPDTYREELEIYAETRN